jgi:hypothetical protein
MSAPIPGYEAPIQRGVWERPCTMGVPRLWAACWLVVCLYAGLSCLLLQRPGMLPLCLIGWLGGHGGLAALTQWEPQWDSVVLAHWTRRYRAYYEEG